MKKILLISVFLLGCCVAWAQSSEKNSYLLQVNADFNAKEFENAGGVIRSRCGDILSTWVSDAQLPKLKHQPGVVVAAPARRIRPLLNKATKSAGVNDVWQGLDMEHGFTGKDVIIGVTDWGFDYTHPVFYDTNMLEYRVLRAWDQFRQEGPAPQGFTYGTEWVGQEQLLQAQCDTDNFYHRHYHATHVASIAAGGGAGTQYRGVAPDAQLLFTTFLVDEAAVLDAFNWMKNVAEEEGKRLVINMSWGLYYMDNLDGTGLLAQAMQTLADLGIVFVTSGGNNGDVNFHVSHAFSGTPDTVKTQIVFDTYGVENYWGEALEMTTSPRDSFSFAFALYSSTFHYLQLTPFYSTAAGDLLLDTFMVYENDTVFYHVSIEKTNPYNERPDVQLRIRQPNGSYRFVLYVAAETGEFHAWNVAELTTGVGNWGYPFAAPYGDWLTGDPFYGLGMPANAEACITVAAHQTGNYSALYDVWTNSAISSFSSYGPTLDGRLKPEISAPGSNVVSALNSFTDQYSGMLSATVDFQGREYAFIFLSGTSMSSPFVAGVAALVLQANPYLSASQVKQVLCETALWDEYAEAAGQERFGHGKVNAYAAVRKALEITGVGNPKVQETALDVFPNPVAETLYLTLRLPEGKSAKLALFDMTGKCLWQGNLSGGVHSLPSAHWPAGCYVLKAFSDDLVLTKKIIKQ